MCRQWTNLIEYFNIIPSYIQTLSDGAVITHSFQTVGTQALSHAIGSITLSVIDNTGTNIFGSTQFANTGAALCPLPGVPIELVRDSGQVMKTNSAADGTFSFSIALGEPVKVRIPPYNGFAWAASYSLISSPTTGRRLRATASKHSYSQLGNSSQMANQSLSATLFPTSMPTLKNYQEPILVHRFTFDHTSATNSEQIPDIVDSNDYAAIHNGVTISNSRAFFSQTANPVAQPYLSLSPGLFGFASAISIEMWVSIDTATQDSAVLFSFGDSSNPDAYVALSASGFQGFVNTYIAVVINPPLNVTQVYINGSLSSTIMFLGKSLFNGDATAQHFNCIGWDLMKTTPGLIGSIDEIRLWDGALTQANITETSILGVDSTLIVFSSNDTLHNIQINYSITSEVVLQVGFYGGLSRNRMFGSESIFSVQALDPQCDFQTTVALDPFYSASNILLPAMNYSVTLLPYTTPLPAPTISYSLCSPSYDPYSYLSIANELSVQVYTNLLESFRLYATFIYHSGLCMQIIGSSYFATSLPSPDIFGRVCYKNSDTMLTRGQKWPLNITLFELYPPYTGVNPAWGTSALSLDVQGTGVLDKIVLDSTVEITDVVSGHPSPTTYTYSDELYSAAVTTFRTPYPLNYSITAATPLPSVPYALPFSVLATRNGPDGAAQVSYKAFIPILGTIPSEVPNFYPVTTDPTLIFLILRDPPGGASHTTIEAGSTFTTGITIQGMKTFEQDLHFDVELGADIDDSQLLITAPLGIGSAESLGHEGSNLGAKGSLIAPDITATRISETHYSYAFKFSYDFSTSDDPYIAGHPSDIIVGGGIDVIVSEALEGTLFSCFGLNYIYTFCSLRELHYDFKHLPRSYCDSYMATRCYYDLCTSHRRDRNDNK